MREAGSGSEPGTWDRKRYSRGDSTARIIQETAESESLTRWIAGLRSARMSSIVNGVNEWPDSMRTRRA